MSSNDTILPIYVAIDRIKILRVQSNSFENFKYNEMKFSPATYKKINDRLQRRLVYTEHLMTVMNDFSRGPWSEPDPFHSHLHEQTLYVAAGEVMFYYENEPEQHLKSGDMVAIPSGKKHTIKLLSSEARIIDNFTPVREDFLK